MTTLRIYDHRDGALALDLRDLVDLLAPRSLGACWVASPVKLNDPSLDHSFDETMITGSSSPGGDDLEQRVASRSVVSGTTLSAAAQAIDQVIWGQFVATLPKEREPWVIIRAIDSTFYEVTSADETVLAAIRSTYKDVRVAPGPVTSVPIEPI